MLKRSVKLRIVCKHLTPVEITEQLGVQPSDTSDGGWALDSPQDETHSLRERIEALLLFLQPVTQQLSAIADDKLLICAYQLVSDDGPHSVVNHGFWLTPEVIGALHDMGIQFTYEIFVIAEKFVEKEQTGPTPSCTLS